MYFCLPNNNELVKHRFWDYIQAGRAWQWATFIMHELCGVRIGRYDNFKWKQTISGERIPGKFSKKSKVWHLLWGVTLWTIWIEHNDKVFNQTLWHESKAKHRIWNELILYTTTAWERVEKNAKTSEFSAEVVLKGFDSTWGARGVLCKRNKVSIRWNSKWQNR